MKPRLQKAVKYFAPVLIVVAVYGVFNLVAFGVQMAVHHSDQQKLNALTSQVTILQNQLGILSKTISSEETQLKTLDAQIKAEEPTKEYAAYDKDVANYNQLAEAYKNDLATYNQQVPEFNAKVDQANKLAKKVGSTWYVLPLATSKH